MKISKIYIKNFKGLKNKTIIDFSNETTILTGPNGFGKTTIFNVLELCLTGKLHNTEVKEKVTSDTKDYRKPFYQNDINQDVVIKLLLEKENEELIIVKYLSKRHDGHRTKGRRNKPNDFNFSTYTEAISSFNDEFDSAGKNSLSQEQINRFFELEDELKIENVFLLFNYLQQEEATFFLKKSEKERKESLGFLFKTQEEEKSWRRIKDLYSNLKAISIKLDGKIDNLKRTGKGLSKGKHKLCFPDKEFDFDIEAPFANEVLNKLDSKKDFFFQQLDGLTDFLNNFSPIEFNKKSKKNRLISLSKNTGFIEYYVLKYFLKEVVFTGIAKKRDVINNVQLLKAYILQNLLPNQNAYKTLNLKITKYEQFIESKSGKAKLDLISDLGIGLFEKNKELFDELILKKNDLEKSFSDLDKIIDELLDLRKEIKDSHESYKQNKIDESSCPYCGYNWDNYESLIKSFDKRTENLLKSNKEKAEKVELVKKEIRTVFLVPIKHEIEEFLKVNKWINLEIMDELELLQENKFDFSLLNSTEFIWGNLKSPEELQTEIKNLQKKLTNDFNISINIFERLASLRGKEFPESLQLLESSIEEDQLDKCILNKISSEKEMIEKTKYLITQIENIYGRAVYGRLDVYVDPVPA